MIGLLLSPVAFLFAVGALLTWVGSRSVPPKVRGERWVKYGTYTLLFWVLFGVATLQDHRALVGAMCLIVATGTFELVRALHRRPWSLVAIALSVHGLLGASLIWLTLLSADRWIRVIFLTVFIFTCTFDAFSQVTGQIWGRRKLVPRLSPGKTTVGAVGGLIFTTGLAVYSREGQLWDGIAFGVPISLAAFAGDLFYSWVKRRCGIKDFGTLLPGHGGVLDRFDSLFATATLAAVWMFF